MEKLLKFLVISILCCFVSSANIDKVNNNKSEITVTEKTTTTTKYYLIDNTISDCSNVKNIFETKNISDVIPDLPVDGSGLKVCRSKHSCCTREMESNLQQLVRKDFQSLLHHKSQTVQGLLATTASALQEHVASLARQSENKTLTLFNEAYKRMFELAQEPITTLYNSLLEYLNTAKNGVNMPSNIPSEDSRVLEDIVFTFFSNLFPLVYHQAVNLHTDDFIPEYKVCLKKSMSEILPFGDYPREIALDIAKSFEEMKVLLEALFVGADILNTTDLLMSSDNNNLYNCYEALLRLYYCPRCNGLGSKIKPCNGYCLNVMRGCLTQQRANELDLPWNNFLIETQRLVKQTQSVQHDSIEKVLTSLTSRISSAIMYASINGPMLEKKVKKACGNAKLVPGTPNSTLPDDELSGPGASVVLPGVTVSSLAPGHSDRSSGQASPLGQQLTLFLDAIATTQARGFYANLAEALCSDENFAETRDTAECWNGQRVGEYTKTLVRPGVDAQKYNPELTWTETDPDPRISQLSDKLRHMRQVVLSQLSQTNSLVSDSFVRDEEGSGSGEQPHTWDSDDDDSTSWVDQGSGSGDGGPPIDTADTSSTAKPGEVPHDGARDINKGGPTVASASWHCASFTFVLVTAFTTRLLLCILH